MAATLDTTGTVVALPAFSQNGTTTTPRDHFGWVAGVGAETLLFGTNWIGRLEYLHYDFGRVEPGTTFTITPGAGSFADSRGRQTIDVVRAGVSYKLPPT